MAKGDQLRVYRGGYWHHGIDVGDGTVVHFIGKADGLRAGVARTPLSSFMLGSTVAECLPARHSPFSADEIVQRALGMVGRHPYNLVLNNCEGMAGFCQGLQPDSAQVKTFHRRASRDLAEHGPLRGASVVLIRLVGKLISLVFGLTGRHRTGRFIEHVTDRRADVEWVTDRNDLRWEPFAPEPSYLGV